MARATPGVSEASIRDKEAAATAALQTTSRHSISVDSRSGTDGASSEHGPGPPVEPQCAPPVVANGRETRLFAAVAAWESRSQDKSRHPQIILRLSDPPVYVCFKLWSDKNALLACLQGCRAVMKGSQPLSRLRERGTLASPWIQQRAFSQGFEMGGGSSRAHCTTCNGSQTRGKPHWQVGIISSATSLRSALRNMADAVPLLQFGFLNAGWVPGHTASIPPSDRPHFLQATLPPSFSAYEERPLRDLDPTRFSILS
jgi:hypothetical protein